LSEEPAGHNCKFKPFRVDLFIGLGLVLLVIVLFAKTVFAGVPISKVHVIAEWDSIFKNFTTGKSQLMDPSLILLMVPYYLLVGRMWHGGELPLWNQYSGFGAPLLADPQSLALSIFHIPLAISPTVATYNFILVIELAVLALGGFILGRCLGLTRIPSVFLGVTLLLCPYEQWYLELLGNGYCLIPILLASFLQTARQATVRGAVLAGMVAGLFVLTAHPELSFCSIAIASIMMTAMMPFSMIGRALVLLLIAGGMAFCLAAPMLLPFVEFLANSDSYKFGNRAPAYYPLQTLAFNLIQPGYGGASPYFGALATLVFPLGLMTVLDSIRRRKLLVQNTVDAWCLRACAVTGSLALLSWVVSAKVYPLGILLTKRPFSYVVVTYFFPVLMVLTAALAAFGLERAISLFARGAAVELVSRYKHGKFEWGLLALAVGLIIAFPLVVDILHVNLNVANFDMTLPPMELNKRDWVRNGLIAGSIFVLMLASSWRMLTAKRAAVIGCLFLIAGACSQFAISKSSLPKRPVFSYPQTETITKLKSFGEKRTVATGDHTLRPNTNLAYDLRDARCHNPIFPRRFLKFIEKSGAKLDEFNQVISNNPSKMLNAAGVAYIVTTDVPLDSEALESSDRFTLAAKTSEGMYIYENRHAVPDAYLVSKTILVDSDEQALEEVADSSFSPLTEVVLERTQGGTDIESPQVSATGSVRITKRASSTVSMETESQNPGILVLTDIHYPGWQATVDGGTVPILQANYAFRAIKVPAGKHRVEFSYRPVPFYAGACLFVIAVLVAVGVFYVPALRRQRTVSTK